MNEIVIGYFGSYEVECIGNVCRVKLYDLLDLKDANYKVSVINGILFIFQNEEDDSKGLFPEHVISNFDMEFMGEWAAIK